MRTVADSLFVTTRLYALLVPDKKGAPRAWVQDGMYMRIWSLLISFWVCWATGPIIEKGETDEYGNVVNSALTSTERVQDSITA